MGTVSVEHAGDDVIKRIQNFMRRNKIKGKWTTFNDDAKIRLIVIQVAKECQRSPELVSARVSALRMADGGLRLQFYTEESSVAA